MEELMTWLWQYRGCGDLLVKMAMIHIDTKEELKVCIKNNVSGRLLCFKFWLLIIAKFLESGFNKKKMLFFMCFLSPI